MIKHMKKRISRIQIWLYRRRDHKVWRESFSTQRGEGGQAYVPREFRKVISLESKDAS